MTVTGGIAGFERLRLGARGPGRLVLPERPRAADVAVPTPLRLLDALGIGDRRAAADAADAARGRRTVLPWRSDHGQLALATVTSGTCGRRPCQRFAMNSPQQRLLAGTHGISAGPSARDSAMTNSVHGATARKC